MTRARGWMIGGVIWLLICARLALAAILDFPPVGASYAPVPTFTSLATGAALLFYAVAGLGGLIACLFAARESQGR